MRLLNLILFVTTILLFSSPDFIAQQKDFNVSGFITDLVTGEELIGTNILIYKDSIDFDAPPLTGTSANRYGFYSVPSLNEGTYIFIFSNDIRINNA